jgi:hypothetical protein
VTLSPVVSVSKPRISSGTWKYFFATLLLSQSGVTDAKRASSTDANTLRGRSLGEVVTHPERSAAKEHKEDYCERDRGTRFQATGGSELASPSADPVTQREFLGDHDSVC